MRKAVVASLVFTLLVVPGAAHAAGDAAGDKRALAEAAELKKKGDELMVGLEYRAALELYEKAHALSADPALLYNRARAHQALSEYPRALDLLEEFARTAPADLKARVPKLTELLEDIRSRVATVDVRCSVAEARILIRDTDAGPCNGQALRTRSGAAKIEVRAEGYEPFVQQVELKGGLSPNVVEARLERAAGAGKGWLTISTAPSASLVVVDDRVLGTSPVEVSLAAGVHRVVVKRDGYDDSKLELTLEEGHRRRLEVSLSEKKPITKTWWFWTGVGAAVVGGTVLTYALLTSRDAPSGSIAPGQVRGP